MDAKRGQRGNFSTRTVFCDAAAQASASVSQAAPPDEVVTYSDQHYRNTQPAIRASPTAEPCGGSEFEPAAPSRTLRS
jgi:hypothetical protein